MPSRIPLRHPLGTVTRMELFDAELYSLIFESREERWPREPHGLLDPFDTEIKVPWLVRFS